MGQIPLLKSKMQRLQKNISLFIDMLKSIQGHYKASTIFELIELYVGFLIN